MIIGWRHAVDIQECEDSIGVAFGLGKSVAQVFGGRVLEGNSTDRGEAALEAGFAVACDGEGNGAPTIYYDDARLVPVTAGLAGTLPLVANPAPDDRWYADLPLAATGATRVAVGFQNNAITREAFVEWVPLNILNVTTGSSITVRKDDAMKLTAYPAGASGGTVTIACNGQSAVTGLTTPAILSFTNAGTYTVTGTWTPASGSPVAGSLSVNVLSGSFPTNPAACLLNVARVWACTNLPAEVVVSAGESNKTVLTQQLLAQGRNLTLTRKDAYRPDYVVARIGQGGPVLCSQKIEPFTMRAAVDGFFWVAQVYPDGRQLWYNLITAARLPSTVQLQIQVIVGGVTLDDLTLERWINKTNLTELDEYNLGLIRSPGLTTSSCHTLRAYQDGVYLGEATYY